MRSSSVRVRMPARGPSVPGGRASRHLRVMGTNEAPPVLSLRLAPAVILLFLGTGLFLLFELVRDRSGRLQSGREGATPVVLVEEPRSERAPQPQINLLETLRRMASGLARTRSDSSAADTTPLVYDEPDPGVLRESIEQGWRDRGYTDPEFMEMHVLYEIDRDFAEALRLAEKDLIDGDPEMARADLLSALGALPAGHRMARLELLEMLVLVEKRRNGHADLREAMNQRAATHAEILAIHARAGLEGGNFTSEQARLLAEAGSADGSTSTSLSELALTFHPEGGDPAEVPGRLEGMIELAVQAKEDIHVRTVRN